jgi:hypothetical protein
MLPGALGGITGTAARAPRPESSLWRCRPVRQLHRHRVFLPVETNRHTITRQRHISVYIVQGHSFHTEAGRHRRKSIFFMIFIEDCFRTLFFYFSIAFVLQAFLCHFSTLDDRRKILEVSVNIYYTSLVRKVLSFTREAETGM